MRPHAPPRRALLAALASLVPLGARAAPDGSLHRVLAAGVLRLGVQVEGTRAASLAADGALLGYLPTLGRRIAAGLGVRPVFVPVRRGDMLGQILAGAFDIGLGGAIASPWVALTVLLSDPIMKFQLVVLTRQDLVIRGMADLRGVRVGVVEGLSFAEAVREAGVDLAEIETFADWEQAAGALNFGGRQAAVVPSYHAPEILRAAPEAEQRFTLGDFWHCCSLHPGHHDLLRALNVLLYLMRQEGELPALHQAFFGRDFPLGRTL